jgi:hypothetical protein
MIQNRISDIVKTCVEQYASIIEICWLPQLLIILIEWWRTLKSRFAGDWLNLRQWMPIREDEFDFHFLGLVSNSVVVCVRREVMKVSPHLQHSGWFQNWGILTGRRVFK